MRDEIEHRQYSDGKVQSLGFVGSDGIERRAGVVIQGEYDFGTAECVEEIQVTYGAIEINGQIYKEGHGEPAKIKLGDRVRFKVFCDTAAYLCTYPKAKYALVAKNTVRRFGWPFSFYHLT